MRRALLSAEPAAAGEQLLFWQLHVAFSSLSPANYDDPIGKRPNLFSALFFSCCCCCQEEKPSTSVGWSVVGEEGSDPHSSVFSLLWHNFPPSKFVLRTIILMPNFLFVLYVESKKGATYATRLRIRSFQLQASRPRNTYGNDNAHI